MTTTKRKQKRSRYEVFNGSPMLADNRPRPPMLHEIMHAPPEPLGTRTRLSYDHKLWLLYRKSRGDTLQWSADAIGVKRGTAAMFIQRSKRDASVFSRVGFTIPVRIGASKRDTLWVCLACMETAQTEAFINKHAYAHVYGRDEWL